MNYNNEDILKLSFTILRQIDGLSDNQNVIIDDLEYNYMDMVARHKKLLELLDDYKTEYEKGNSSDLTGYLLKCKMQNILKGLDAYE